MEAGFGELFAQPDERKREPDEYVCDERGRGRIDEERIKRGYRWFVGKAHSVHLDEQRPHPVREVDDDKAREIEYGAYRYHRRRQDNGAEGAERSVAPHLAVIPQDHQEP